MFRKCLFPVLTFSAFLLVVLFAAGCGGDVDKSRPPKPTEEVMQALVKGTIADLADALDLGDFKIFWEKASEEFRMTVPEHKLISTFKPYAEKKAITVPFLRKAIVNIAKILPISVHREEKGGLIMIIDGTFDVADSEFKTVNFNNEYVWQEGEWKLLILSVETK